MVEGLWQSDISRLPNDWFNRCDKLRGNTVEQVPVGLQNGWTALRTEALEGAIKSKSEKEWGVLSPCEALTEGGAHSCPKTGSVFSR